MIRLIKTEWSMFNTCVDDEVIFAPASLSYKVHETVLNTRTLGACRAEDAVTSMTLITDGCDSVEPDETVNTDHDPK